MTLNEVEETVSTRPAISTVLMTPIADDIQIVRKQVQKLTPNNNDIMVHHVKLDQA